MKLLTAAQWKQWDAYTIQQKPITSIDLMEQAAQACVEWMQQHNFIENKLIYIFCAQGNNGGDGLAIARLLSEYNTYVEVFILPIPSSPTPDFSINLERLKHSTSVRIHYLTSAELFPQLPKQATVIDALFGSGLNRPATGLAQALINYLNKAAVTAISIDVPSGMFVSNNSYGNTIIRAKHTLTFEATKLCFMVDDNAPFYGTVHILPIGLLHSFLANIETPYQTITQHYVRKIYKTRVSYGHKGMFGHLLLVAGHAGTIGAAVLAAQAALRSGTGLLSVNIPAAYENVMYTSTPEAMVVARQKKEINLKKYNALAVGCGLGTDNDANQLLELILTQNTKPAVYDADALNLIALHPNWLAKLNSQSIITPHPKEFDRLFGISADGWERMQKAIELSQKYPFVIVLKGSHTLIAQHGKAFFNTIGNVGLAKGGSGDTLTGIIGALLAQNYSALEAAQLGVYLHGLAADIAIQKQSVESLLATDVTALLGAAFKKISS